MTEEVGKQTINADDKLFALLSLALAPIVSIIMLMIEDKRQRKFIEYAAFHGVAIGVIGYVISAFIPFLGFILSLAVFLYLVFLGLKAFNGEWVTVPFITDFLAGQGWIEAPAEGVEVTEAVETVVEEVKEEVAEVVEDVKEEAAEVVEDVKEEAAEIVEDVEDAAEAIEPEE